MHAGKNILSLALPDRWDRIETVCLDMDGTVLDLRFDNLFWLEALPRRWGEMHGVTEREAFVELKRRFDARRGTLDWYCIDHWSEELGVDIAALKVELRDEIRFLPGAVEFLGAVRNSGKRLLLTTNAHPISLSIKSRQTGLGGYFDELVSSHEFGVPKESATFWVELERKHGVAPARVLFVDDSPGVLQAARAAGVGQVIQMLRPDSTQPAHAPEAGFEAIDSLREISPPVLPDGE
jgi:putative hydrolase of the HAD superfamily